MNTSATKAGARNDESFVVLSQSAPGRYQTRYEPTVADQLMTDHLPCPPPIPDRLPLERGNSYDSVRHAVEWVIARTRTVYGGRHSRLHGVVWWDGTRWKPVSVSKIKWGEDYLRIRLERHVASMSVRRGMGDFSCDEMAWVLPEPTIYADLNTLTYQTVSYLIEVLYANLERIRSEQTDCDHFICEPQVDAGWVLDFLSTLHFDRRPHERMPPFQNRLNRRTFLGSFEPLQAGMETAEQLRPSSRAAWCRELFRIDTLHTSKENYWDLYEYFKTKGLFDQMNGLDRPDVVQSLLQRGG